VTITGNTAGDDGGGIYNTGTLTINGATVGGTTAGAANHAASGGGIYNSNLVKNTSSNVTIQGNTATEDGGGIYSNSTFSITTGTISGNSATNRGGGVWTDDTFELIGFKITGNTSGDDGGGIYEDCCTNLVQDTIDGNHTGGTGGGIWSDGNVRMIQSTVSNNTAAEIGGGFYGEDNTASLNSDTFSGNTATGDGGGIYETSGTIAATDLSVHPIVALSRAAAPREPAISLAPNLTISGNAAGGNGGGIALTNQASGSATMGLLNATIADNKTTGNKSTGGGVWLNSASNVLEIKATLIARNTPQNCQDDGSGPQIAEPGTPNSANFDTGNNTCELNTLANASDKINLADPKLGALADNFGFTKTQALLFGSPAIDSVPSAGACSGGTPVPPVDERGMTRPQAAQCDTGAYECIGASPVVTQVQPSSGPPTGGTVLTITGTGFDRPATVTVGGTPAVAVTINSSTQITATTPPGKGVEAISIQTCRANNPASSVSAFTFVTLPAAGQPHVGSGQGLVWAWLLLILALGAPALALLAYAYRPESRV
jgi:predicted outer membrane repeat protein